MGIDWELASSSHKCSGDKQSFINELVTNTNGDLEEYVTAFDIKINLDFCREIVTVTRKRTGEKVTIPALMEIQAGKDMQQNSLVRLFRYSNEYTFEAGDYVTYTPNNKSCGERTYILASNPEPHKGYCSAYAFECTHYYNTYNKHGEIVKIWFYTDDNKLIMRDTNVKVIRNEDIGTIMVTVPDNEITRMLGAEQKRILVDGNAFKVIGVSFINGVAGILVVMIQIDAKIIGKDDEENGIAYNEKVLEKIEEQKPVLKDICISGEDTLGLGYTEMYEINTAENVSWSVSNKWIKLTPDLNKCEVYIPKRDSLINKEVTLTATINDKEYTKILKIEG